MTLCRNFNPQPPWGRRLLGLSPPCRPLLDSCGLRAPPTAPLCQSSFQQLQAGLGQRSASAFRQTCEGSLPSPGVVFLMCHAAVGRTGSDQSPWLGVARRRPRPSPASRPDAPSARSAQPARSRPRTILALSGAPASRVYCNLRLRLFSRAEPQPCSSSQRAAQQPWSPVPEPLSRVGIQARCPSP